MQSRDKQPSEVKKVDIIAGGDHDQGSFITGEKINVSLAVHNNNEQSAFSFEISVNEILCKKDNADILRKTMKDGLTKGLQTIAENQLNLSIESKGLVHCSFGEALSGSDLAFYAMVLVREFMSGQHCYLCMLASKEYAYALVDGEPWFYNHMEELSQRLQAEQTKNRQGKKEIEPHKGIKESPWWDFIPF